MERSDNEIGADFQTLSVTTRARPDSASAEADGRYRSSSSLQWLRCNQLSSNFLELGYLENRCSDGTL